MHALPEDPGRCLTVAEVVAWISTSPDVTDLVIPELLESLQGRNDRNRAERLSPAHIGASVVLSELVPDCYNGLTGRIVDSWEGEDAVDVLLTPASTGRLRFTGRPDGVNVGAVDQYIITGVPRTACFLPDTAIAM